MPCEGRFGEVANQMDAIEAANGRVVGTYYGEAGLLTIEEINTMMDSFGWVGGYRIVDSPSLELYNAKNGLWPAAPGVFVLSTEDMTVVACEASGVQLDLVAIVEGLNI